MKRGWRPQPRPQTPCHSRERGTPGGDVARGVSPFRLRRMAPTCTAASWPLDTRLRGYDKLSVAKSTCRNEGTTFSCEIQKLFYLRSPDFHQGEGRMSHTVETTPSARVEARRAARQAKAS